MLTVMIIVLCKAIWGEASLERAEIKPAAVCLSIRVRIIDCNMCLVLIMAG